MALVTMAFRQCCESRQRIRSALRADARSPTFHDASSDGPLAGWAKRGRADLGIMAPLRASAHRHACGDPVERNPVMKLYYSPGACSLSPHIALCEAGMKFELVKAVLQTHTLADGSDYYQITAKGQVPLLELDDGSRLSEGPAILQYIADHAPASGLAPAAGTMERYRVMEWLNFITSELHKTYSPLFNPAVPEEYKTIARSKLADRYRWLDTQLEGKSYLMGDTFGVADAYLFTVTNWAKHVGVDLAALKNVGAFTQRVAARPAVQEAMQAEGLLK
jgi:glutathione S-transferase